jgi:hypothetical protein
MSTTTSILNTNTIFSQSSVNTLKGFLDNNYVSGGLQLFIILYAALAAPQLPVSMAKMFHVPAFQLALFSLIAYTATKDIGVSVMLAIAFFVSFQTYKTFQAHAHVVAAASVATPVAHNTPSAVVPLAPSYVHYAHLDTDPVQEALNREARDIN